MGLFGKKELTWEEVPEFLKEHAHEINDVVAADLVNNTTGYTLSKAYTYQNGEWKSTQVSYGG